jgi:hypothetical protein
MEIEPTVRAQDPERRLQTSREAQKQAQYHSRACIRLSRGTGGCDRNPVKYVRRPLPSRLPDPGKMAQTPITAAELFS